MFGYIDFFLAESQSDMNGISKTRVVSRLFNLNNDVAKLDEEKAQLFHDLVAKLLYISRRSRQNIQSAVAFLCTRVQQPDVDDYKKQV